MSDEYDIKSRNPAANSLTVSNEQLEDAIESISDAFVLYDALGNLVLCNQKHLEFYPHLAQIYRPGISRDEVMSHHAKVIHENDPSFDVDGYLKERLNLQLTPRPDQEVQLADGRWIAIRERPVAGGGMVSIRTDITKRKELENVKNELVATVSHELRTPLTSIFGSLSLIRNGAAGDMPREAQQLIEIAHNNCQRLVSLVNNILDMEKIEAGKYDYTLAPVSIAELIQDAVVSNAPYGTLFDVLFEVSGDVPDLTVNGDYQRLLHVLTNLLSNAAKHSHKGGRVAVFASQSDGFAKVSVRDWGTGIPDEFRDKLFEKFSMADSSGSETVLGTGLGLSICQAIIDRHEGRIDFTSKQGVGSTFFFELPLLSNTA